MQWAKNKQAGFTIVELLIVVVVIAILAAITIVSYNGITNQANDAAVQNDLRAAQKLIETSSAKTGAYPAVPLTAALGIKPSKGAYMTGRNNFYYCLASDGKAFAVSGVSKSGASFAITSHGDLRTGVSGGDPTCALIGGGSWNAGMGNPENWASWTN